MYKPQANDELFVSGDGSRLFLNLELGCSSSCSYCYLPTENMQLGQRPPINSTRSPEELIYRLQADKMFKPGRDGTILSIGCFSECWDPAVRQKTIMLIKSLLLHDNWIQFATKREIHRRDLQPIVEDANWRGQAVAYISSATISKWHQFERGTTRPERRFKSFAVCTASGVRSCLYIKPVLPDVTIRDASLYGTLMKDRKVDVVVGDLFVPGVASGNTVSPISKLLHVADHADAVLLRTQLTQHGRVFKNSTKHLTQDLG